MSTYAPAFSHRHSAPQRIRDAYAAAGLPAPQFAHDVAELLAAVPTAKQVAAELGQDAVGVDNPQAWIEEALEKLARARDTDALRSAVKTNREAAVTAKLPSALAQASVDLAPAFDKHMAALTKAADILPAGDPLSAEAAVLGDHGKHLRATREALATIGTLVSAWGVPEDGEKVLRSGQGYVLAAVDVVDTEPEMVAEKFRGTANPDRDRTVVREFLELAAEDVDLALIAVARGDYGDAVWLSLPESPRAVVERFRRAKRALTRFASSDLVIPSASA